MDTPAPILAAPIGQRIGQRLDVIQRRALARQLRDEGDPRAAHLRRPGRPGASPEQRAADQQLVLDILTQHTLTRAGLATLAGLSRSTIGLVAAGQRALSDTTRKAIAGVAAKLTAGAPS